MKKLLFIALALSFTFSVAKADGRDKVITKEQLPSAAQQLLASHFSGLKILLVSEDREFVSRNYEVLLRTGQNWSLPGMASGKNLTAERVECLQH